MKIGKIIAINYSQLKVKILSEIRGGSVNRSGEVYYFGNIGSFLKVSNSLREIIICEVISIFDSDSDRERLSFDMESDREILIKPIGTIGADEKFSLGIGVFPSLYSDVNIVTNEDVSLILNTIDIEQSSTEGKVHKKIRLGRSKNLINYPIDIAIDSFFNIHTAILGNSGSGKSNTIAHILQQVFEKTAHDATGAKILMFDVNGEYRKAFVGIKNKNISVRFFKPNSTKEGEKFFLPHFLMTLEEWSSFLLATEATQRPFWDKVLQESYRFYKIGNGTNEEKEKFINYLRYRACSLVYSVLAQADTDTSRITTAAGLLGSISSLISNDASLRASSQDLLADIQILRGACTIAYGNNNGQLGSATENVMKKVNSELVQDVLNSKIKYGEYFSHQFLKIASELVLIEEDARGNKQIRGYTATMLTRLEYFLENSDCDFMRLRTEIKSVEHFFTNLWGESTKTQQLVIIDTSELSPDILETLTSVISRLIFDIRKKLEGDNRRKTPVHLVLDEAHRYIKKDHKYLLIENIFEKIAREGRKYSLYLLVSSQRPSELSETVLSQCANFIVHRIQNARDMQYIQAILPYFSEDFTNKIKQSTPGEALVFGNCVTMPLHIKINEAKPAPNSDNCIVSEEWFLKKENKG